MRVIKKSDSSKVNEAGKNFKAIFFKGGEIFQVIMRFHNCSPCLACLSLNTVLQVLIQAVVRFPFTAWCCLGLGDQLGTWISSGKILKYALF